VVEARSENFPCWSEEVKPGVPFSTRKPRTPSSVRAQTTATSASVPLVIHCLAPLRSQPFAVRRAVVRMPPGLEPKSGSVRPKQPIASPLPSGGSQRAFCSAEPKVWIGYMTSELCTEAKLRSPESPRSSSCMMRP